MPATEHAPANPVERVRPARLRVRVSPGARRSELVGRLGEARRVRVSAPHGRGRANDEVRALLAAALGCSEIRVVAGPTSRDKVVEVDRLTLDEAERRLAAAGNDPR